MYEYSTVLFIQSSSEGHLGYHLLAIVNSAAMNVDVCVFA